MKTYRHVPNPAAIQLFRMTLEFITQRRDAHNQDDWLIITDEEKASELIGVDVTPQNVGHACGTAGCLAGNAVILSGRYPIRIFDPFDYDEPYLKILINGEWKSVSPEIEPLAIKLLDLTMEQAATLFAPGNTLGFLWAIAELITDGAIVAPPGLVDEFDRDDAREELGAMTEREHAC